MLFTAVSALAAETSPGFISLSGDELSKVDIAPFMTALFRTDASIADFINILFKTAISVGAMLAVLQLARAGLLYMGSDAWGQTEKAKGLMQSAVVGLLLLLGVWLILNQINPQILNLDVLRGVQMIPATPPASSAPTNGRTIAPGAQSNGLPTDPLNSTFLGAP